MPDQQTYLSYFTPSQMTHEALEAIFVRRQALAERLVEKVRDSALTGAKHQTLLLGPRGIGKSYMVALVYHRVKAIEELRDHLAIAWLAEEEWSVASLADLLLVVLKALDREYGGLTERIDALYRLPAREIEAAASALLREVAGNRTLLILVENLEEIFRGLGADGQWSFRSLLSEQPFVTILATTPSLFGGIENRHAAFYGWFQNIYLDELDVDEAAELLVKVAERRGEAELLEFLQTPAARMRIQAVHHLAGGHPRIYLLFAHLISDTGLDQLVKPFLELLDELTPYYQSRMQLLSPQQRKIVEHLSDKRIPVPVKDIADRTLMSPQTASGQLDKLEGLGYVRKDREGRESLYELREPLLRLVIEVKRSRGEPLRLIVDFLRNWYERDERKERLAMVGAENELARAYLMASLDLRRAVSDMPDLERAGELAEEIKAHLRAGQFDRAVELAERLVEELGSEVSAKALMVLGACQSHLGDHKAAVESFDRAIAIQPDDASTWHCQGIALASVGDYSAAVESFDRAIAIQPDEATAWYNRGIALARIGDYSAAVESYDRAIAIQPDHASAWNNRGYALFHLGDYSAAIESYDRAVAILPDEASAWTTRGIALARIGEYSAAIESLDRSIAIETDDASAWFTRGIALASNGDYSAAIESLDRSIAIETDDASAWFTRGIALASNGDYSAAVESYDRAIAIQPDEATAWYNRGIALARIGEYSAAVESYDRAVAIQPDEATAWYNRGIALADLGDYSAALESFDRAIAIQPDHASAWHNRGYALASNGDYSAAIESFDRAIAIQPDHASAWYNRGNALSDLGDYSAAVESYDRAIAITPEDSLSFMMRAHAHFALGNTDAALKDIGSGLKLRSRKDAYPGPTRWYCWLLLSSDRFHPAVTDLAMLYDQHQLLAELARGLAQSIPQLLQAGVTIDNAERWLAAWEAARESLASSAGPGAEGRQPGEELIIPLRILKAAVAWKKKPGRRALLSLPLEERRVLESLLPGGERSSS